MKVTPLAQGSGSPAGATVGQERMPADRIAAAKAVAAGQSPMRLAESDTPVDPQVEKAKRSIRRIKMRTQASPDRAIEQMGETAPVVENPTSDASDPVAETTQSAISDTGEPTQTPEETKPLSPQFAALARQKRALQVKERELAEREAKLAQPPEGEYVSKADLIANPLKVFELGVTYDQLTEALLANQSGITPELKALQAKVDALEKGVDTKLTERDAQAKQQVLAEMTREANQLVAQGEDYALVREKGYIPKVIQLIDKTYEETGEILDVSYALNLVEEQLLQDEVKIANLEKVRSKITPAQVEPQQPQKQIPQMRTLTNRDSAAPALDRRSRAMLAFHGQLKR